MGELKIPKDLFKNSLNGKNKTEKYASLKSLNVISDSKINNQLYFQKDPSLSSRKNTKKLNPYYKRSEQAENEHVHLIDMSSSEKVFKMSSNLKHTLRRIQKKYVSKISKLLDATPIRITPMPIAAFSQSCSKHRLKKTSAFSSLNRRHPGTGRYFK